MRVVDWIVMFGTLFFIVAYGIVKTRSTKNIETYLKGGHNIKWWSIGIGVMATQASAITFLSTPGQAYDDGMRFLQFYLGLPLAMIIISTVFIPLYYKLKVYTAYEYLESRFDLKTRALTAILFLIQRALSTGITIYAPSIILSQLLGWPLNSTVIFIGGIVTLYILVGGNKAISVTHKQQMFVIYMGMFIVFGCLVYYISQYVSFNDSLQIAGSFGKMNIISTGITHNTFDWNDKYNIISGIVGGFFLQLSYFGTDQSQVGRYLGGESVKEIRLGLLFNGLLKIPVQFFILLTGVLLFVFYQFTQPPAYFNQVALTQAENSIYADSLNTLKQEQETLFADKKNTILEIENNNTINEQSHTILKNHLASLDDQNKLLDTQINTLIKKANPGIEDDHDYIFMSFVMNYLPVGIVGLLFAVIFCASMSSTSSALNALATTFTMDIYKRMWNKKSDDKHYLNMSRLFTAFFGAFAIGFALVCSLFDNLIEAVNILGSLFYGTILGIFLTAFYLKGVRSNAVFIAASISQVYIIMTDQAIRHHWNIPVMHVGYLWYNVIGCLLVIILSYIFSMLKFTTAKT